MQKQLHWWHILLWAKSYTCLSIALLQLWTLTQAWMGREGEEIGKYGKVQDNKMKKAYKTDNPMLCVNKYRTWFEVNSQKVNNGWLDVIRAVNLQAQLENMTGLWTNRGSWRRGGWRPILQWAPFACLSRCCCCCILIHHSAASELRPSVWCSPPSRCNDVCISCIIMYPLKCLWSFALTRKNARCAVSRDRFIEQRLHFKTGQWMFVVE